MKQKAFLTQAQGFAGLLADMKPEAAARSVEAPEAAQTVKGNYKTVCYSIPPDLAEKVKRIARIDRKTIGAVVSEAFEQYIEQWKQLPPQPEPSREDI